MEKNLLATSTMLIFLVACNGKASHSQSTKLASVDTPVSTSPTCVVSKYVQSSIAKFGSTSQPESTGKAKYFLSMTNKCFFAIDYSETDNSQGSSFITADTNYSEQPIPSDTYENAKTLNCFCEGTPEYTKLMNAINHPEI